MLTSPSMFIRLIFLFKPHSYIGSTKRLYIVTHIFETSFQISLGTYLQYLKLCFKFYVAIWTLCLSM